MQNVPKKILRRTEDKTSLVSIEHNNRVLITNDQPKEKPSLPSKSLIKPFKKGFLNAPLKQIKPIPKPKEMMKEEIPFIRSTKPKEQYDNIPGDIILGNQLNKLNFF